jgi:hypothetical protein
MTYDPEATPPETPQAKRRRSWRASYPPRQLGVFGTIGGLLAVATVTVDPGDARDVFLLSAAWLAYAITIWLARR